MKSLLASARMHSTTLSDSYYTQHWCDKIYLLVQLKVLRLLRYIGIKFKVIHELWSITYGPWYNAFRKLAFLVTSRMTYRYVISSVAQNCVKLSNSLIMILDDGWRPWEKVFLSVKIISFMINLESIISNMFNLSKLKHQIIFNKMPQCWLA